MNRLFSLRNPVGVIGAVAAFVFSLSACGDDSGNSSYNANDFSLQVESMGELPNCSKNRSGDIAEVLGERKAYVCDNGRWEFDHDILDSVETEDDLPACLSKNEGNSVWVVDESAVFACIDRKWEKREREEPESSSATKKTASSSSKKQEISSSSVKKETSSSSKPLSSSSISQKSSSSVISSTSSVSSPVSSWSGGGAGAIGSITDSRDGQTYKTVTVGTQTWMAQNLTYKTANSYCYGDTSSNCNKYGRLYTWDAAASACPSGWHLPTKEEFETLFTVVGGQSTAGKMLKSTSGWSSSGDSVSGTDAFSFSALPAGYRNGAGDFTSEGEFAYFWSSTENNYGNVYLVYLYYNSGKANMNLDLKSDGFSVRCVKGESAEQKSSSSVSQQSSSSVTKVSSSSAKSSSSIASNSSETRVSSSSSAKSSSSISATSSSSSVKLSSSSSAKSSSSSAKSSSSVAKSSSSSAKSSSSSSAKSSSSSAKSSSSSVAKSSSSSVKSSSSSSAKSSSSSVVESGSSSSSVVNSVSIGSFTDSRDGQTYKTVKIGWQTWMAQNLNYKTANSYCYNDKDSNCSKYGRLYTWAAAMDSAGKWSLDGSGCGYGLDKRCAPRYPVQGVCPVGWHLPSVSEWNTLLTGYPVGGEVTAGKVLKSTSGWISSGNGTDAYSFSALPAGIRFPTVVRGVYDLEGNYAYFWSSTEFGDSHAYYMYLFYSSDGAELLDTDVFKNDAISVRCLKN